VTDATYERRKKGRLDSIREDSMNMRQLGSVVLFIFALSSSAVAEESANQIGRYQIVTSNLAAKFTFLLDTVTGQVWQFAKYTDVNGDPELWEPMIRIDSQSALTELINAKGIKQKPTPPRQPTLQRPR
jgi:hypothetical protein